MIEAGEGRIGAAPAWRIGRKLGEAIGSLTFPVDCSICDAEVPGQAAPFCEDCRSELLDAAGPACRRCAMPVGPFAGTVEGCGDCSGRRLGFDAAVAIGPYQGPIRHLCLRLKRKEHGWIAPRLVDLLLEARGPAIRDVGAVAVAPVPLHWRRRFRRGYDQADALARALADRLRLPMARALRRVRRTDLLWRLGRVERQEALRGAFRVERRALAGLEGRPILLVDDILTTGATCGAAARALKAAGSGPVVAVVLARAEGRA